MSSADHNVGAIVSLSPPEEGDNIWEAKQVELARSLPPGNVQGRHDIDWGFGPIKVTGYLDTDTYELGVSVSVAGINLGNIFGNLKDGVGIKVNLFIAKGEIRFYLKNGNELWIHLDIKITFDGHYEGDYKIFSF
ncbi:hypothetical protein ACHAPI_012331 [Fusarium lateritium]